MPADTKTTSLSPSDLLVHAGSRVFVLRIVAVALALVVELLLTRTLGQEQYGVLSIGLSWLLILSVISSFGMNTALVRFIPADLAHGRAGLAIRRTRYALHAMVTGSVVVSAIFATAVWASAPGASTNLVPVLLIMALLVPIQTINLHRVGVLQALKQPLLALLPDQVIRFGSFALLLLALPYVVNQANALHGSWGVGISLLAALVAGQLFLRHRTPRAEQAEAFDFSPRTMWSTAIPLGWMTLMALFAGRADPAMIGWLAGPEEAALFSLADRISTLLLFGLVAVNAIAAPLIAELWATGNTEELQRVLSKAAVGIALYTLPLAAVIIIVAPFVLPFFGPGFEATFTPLCWLVAGQSMNALAGSVGYLMMMTGNHRKAAQILTVAAVLKIGLNLVLVPIWGATGAAIGSVIMLVGWNGALLFVVIKKLGVDPTLLSLGRG